MSGAPEPNWKKRKTEPESEDWLVTYADAITLLMAFFVMLVSFSKIDLPTFDAVMAGIAKDIGGRESVSPLQLLKIDLQDVVYTMQAEEAVAVGSDSKGIVIELDGGALFDPGTARLREASYPLLSSLSKTLTAPRYQIFAVQVEGHTDDDPISTAVYPSNWELSTGRAASVVRFFIGQGITSQRMSALGYAETQPKFANRTADGTPLPLNKAENRRVVLRIQPHQTEYEFGDVGRRYKEPEPEVVDQSSLVGTKP